MSSNGVFTFVFLIASTIYGFVALAAGPTVFTVIVQYTLAAIAGYFAYRWTKE